MDKNEYRVIVVRGVYFKVYEDGECEYKYNEEDEYKPVNWQEMGKPEYAMYYGTCFVDRSMNKTFTIYQHTIVCKAYHMFTGLNPDGRPIKGKKEVNHVNKDTMDNRPENLEWCDRTYNNAHRTRVRGYKWHDNLGKKII